MANGVCPRWKHLQSYKVSEGEKRSRPFGEESVAGKLIISRRNWIRERQEADGGNCCE